MGTGSEKPEHSSPKKQEDADRKPSGVDVDPANAAGSEMIHSAIDVTTTASSNHDAGTGNGDVDVDVDDVMGNSGGNKSRHRPRKRRLYTAIQKQMAFYFSDANILKNRLMQDMVMKNEFIDLSVFMEFNRMKKLTGKVEDLQKALVTSDKLELSPDGKGVNRKVPFDPKKVKSVDQIEDCTIYVENVPRHVDHDWLETIFQNFGPIAYVSLPKFRNSNKPKGFAFVEYDNAESAQGCLEAYKGEGGVLPADMNPAELMSIQTFNEEMGDETQRTTRSNSKKEKGGEVKAKEAEQAINDASQSPKKRKLDPSEGNSPPEITKKKLKVADDEADEDEEADSGDDDLVQETETGEGDGDGTKKRNRRKKNKTKNSAEEKLEGDALYLKVMPKKAWRQLRNRYLNLQRQNMSKLKRELKDRILRETYYKGCSPSGNPDELRSFVMEIKLDSPAESDEAFKKQIRNDLAGESDEESAISGFIKYIDYQEGSLAAYVRFGEDESFTKRIQNLVANAEKVFPSARMLSALEAQQYKEYVLQTLKDKSKVQPKSKLRGKDRLLKAATKSASHIRFDEPDGPTDKSGITAGQIEGTGLEAPETELVSTTTVM